MENSKLIHNYLDEGLGEVEQDILFKNLADDQELRHEFNQQMKIHSISKNDMASIQPPMESTEAIFSQLGFQVPAAANSHRAAVATSSIFNKKNGIITAALLLFSFSVASFMIGNDFLSDSQPEFAEGSSATNQSIPVVSQYSAEESKTDQQTTLLASNNSDISNQNASNITNNSDRRNTAYGNINTISTPNNNANIALSETNEGNSASEEAHEAETFIVFEAPISQSQSVIMAVPQSELQQQNLQALTLDKILDNDNVMLAMRNSSPTSFSPNNVAGQSGTNLNWGTSLLYRASFMDENLWIGLSAGSEQFAQTFTSIDNGVPFETSQSPFLYYGGLDLRYDMKNIGVFDDKLYPTVQLMLGANSMGPMTRGQLGLAWNPIGKLNINVGVEMTQSWFSAYGSTYNSGNYGLYYGIGYTF
jgi:hypothetical protein